MMSAIVLRRERYDLSIFIHLKLDQRVFKTRWVYPFFKLVLSVLTNLNPSDNLIPMFLLLY